MAKMTNVHNLLRYIGYYAKLMVDDVMVGYRDFWTRCHGGLQYFTVGGGRIFLSVED